MYTEYLLFKISLARLQYLFSPCSRFFMGREHYLTCVFFAIHWFDANTSFLLFSASGLCQQSCSCRNHYDWKTQTTIVHWKTTFPLTNSKLLGHTMRGYIVYLSQTLIDLHRLPTLKGSTPNQVGKVLSEPVEHCCVTTWGHHNVFYFKRSSLGNLLPNQCHNCRFCRGEEVKRSFELQSRASWWLI